MVLPSLSLSRSMEGKGGGLGRFFKTKSRDDDSKKMKEKQTRTRPGLFRLNSSRSECLTATPTRCSTDDGEFKDDLSYSFEQTPNRDPPGKGSGTPPLRETRSSPTKADTTWFVEEYLRERSSSADLSSPVRKPDGRIFLRRLEEARSLDLTKRQSLSSVASKMPLSDDPEENSHDSENLDKESKDDISEVDLEATIPYKREYSTSKNSSRSHRSKRSRRKSRRSKDVPVDSDELEDTFDVCHEVGALCFDATYFCRLLSDSIREHFSPQSPLREYDSDHTLKRRTSCRRSIDDDEEH